MTKTEVKDLLINRVEFRNSTTIIPQSGRYFESEHPIVTLENIKECQPKSNISDIDFNTYLLQLKTDTIYQLLSDVFDRDNINDNLFVLYPALFDNAISLLMTVKVINLIITSSRSNRTERISKEVAQQIHFDLNGNYGNDMNPSYPRAYGIAYRYEKELRRIKNNTGNQRKLVNITQVR